MKRIIITLATILLTVISVNAVPAKPGVWKTLRLVDGSTVRAEQKGDEYLSFWQSEDGRVFQQSGSDNIYQAVDANLLREQWSEMMQEVNSQRLLARKTIKKEYAIPSKVKGTFKGLVILVDFPDTKFESSHTNAFFKEILNTENLNKEGYAGSVHDYFYDQSSGDFNITFDVLGPYTMSHDTKYYGENASDNIKKDLNHREMIIEACNAAHKENVDFSKYVWYDNSNEVELVFVVYAGKGENENASETNLLWPKMSTLNKEKKYDGVYVNTYAISNESDGIGTFCHEFSHGIGLPDVYDAINEIENKSYGVGQWDLMDHGNYNGGGKYPPNYSSYERYFCGWLTPFEMDAQREVRQMKSLSDSQDAYAIYNQANKNELFLLENRTANKWDRYLPGNGLLIWHIYYDEELWKKTHINNKKNKPLYYIVPADGDRTANTETGDAYPYSNNNFCNNEFGVTSSPLAKFYDADENGICFPDYDVKNISKDDNGLVSFDFKLPLTVNRLLIDQLKYEDEILYGNTVTGTVKVKNNGYKSYTGNITIGLFDENTQLYKEKMKDYTIGKLSDHTINFNYEGLEANHTYYIYVAYNYSNEIYRSARFTCKSDAPVLEVTSLELDNANMKEKTFTGTTMSGHLLLQNNNYKTNKDHVYVFIYEEGDTEKPNPDKDPIYCDLFVHPNQTQTIFFDFNQLEEGHRYAVVLTDFEMKEFYRSDYFTCLPEAAGSLAVGKTFKARTVENVEVIYKVVSTSPKQVIVEPVKNGEMDYDSAINKNTVGTVTIPSTVNGYTVTGIGNNAFYDCQKITEVNLPLTVKSIGRAAFFYCSALESVTGMDGITAIEEVAFKLCEKMKAFNLPHTLKRIGSQTFANCNGLTSFILPSSVTLLEAGDLFMDCENMKSIIVEKENPVYDSRGDCNAFIRTADNTLIGGCSTTIIPFGVTAIASGALSSTPGLKKIELPPTVTSIGKYAFIYCMDLEGIVSHSQTPLPIDANMFNGYSYDSNWIYNNATLYVPKGCKAKYKAAEGWGRFAKIEEMSEKVEMALLYYKGWTYSINKQYANANASRRQTGAQNADVRTNADGWPMYKATLTLDATNENGTTNSYVIDNGGLFLDMSDMGTYQRPALLFDENTKQLRIFINSKSEGEDNNMDGFVYTSSLDDINFQKETVFENKNWGWYAYFKQSDDGLVQICHYDMDEYNIVTSTDNGNGTYDNEVGDEIILPSEALDASEESGQTYTIEARKPADVDFNRVIDVNDVILVTQAICGESHPNADVNGDGHVDIADILSIIHKININEYIKKVEAIDLGLPSGTLWASCNLGATMPEEFGDLYAWGETSPKEEFTEENYAYYNMAKDSYIDLGNNGNISGLADYDAVTALMGTSWRTPTYSDFYELKNNCQTEWTTVNGIRGIRIIGPNGNSIFLPATKYDNEDGYYWSSRQYTGDSNPWAVSCHFNVMDKYVSWAYGYFRYLGFNIRPVKDK